MIIMNNKNFVNTVLLACAVAWGLFGCVAGVPNYEGDCEQYLLDHGYSREIVDAFLKRDPIDANVIAKNLHAPKIGVRVVLATNPHLTYRYRQVLWNDKSQYVRKALATNLQLSKDEISMIINDNHLFVLPGLASNPAVPHQALLQVYKKLREQGSNGWDDFVMNPNCPKEIIGEIMDKSNDNVPFIDEHRVWLLNTMERKEEFRKAKAQGYPFPKGEYYPWGHADIWWRNDEVDIGMRNGGTP